MSDGPRLRDYLGHILEAIERIERYTEDLTEAAFLSKGHELVQDAVIRNFEVIGEASRNIEKRHPEFLAAHAERHCWMPTTCAMPWRMGTSRWISNWSGIRCSRICPSCMNASREYFRNYPDAAFTAVKVGPRV